MQKYKYMVHKTTGLIQRFDTLVPDSSVYLNTMGQWCNIPLPLSCMIDCRPIDKRVVKFFEQDGGYNKNYFATNNASPQ